MVQSFLKRLDNRREKQIKRMVQADIRYGQGRQGGTRRTGQPPIPTGFPFSYFAQFKNAGGTELIRRP